jgi:hypothetical protein
MSYVDLGKAHIRARLYNDIPGVIKDTAKLRKNFTWAVTINDGSNNSISYNTTALMAYSKNGDVLSGCVIPQPIFEPIDNFMLDRNNASNTNYTDVYWKQVGNQESTTTTTTTTTTPTTPTATPEASANSSGSTSSTAASNGVNPFDSVKSVYMKTYLKNMDDAVLRRNRQKWISQFESVSPERYSDKDYDAQPITYRGTGYIDEDREDAVAEKPSENDQAQSQPDDSEKAEDSKEEENDTKDIVQTYNSSFVRQVEAEAGVWWGIETVSPFKDKGHPFWVVIRPDAINIPKDSKAVSLLSIVISESEGDNGSGTTSGDSIGFVELVIENTGRTFVNYEYRARNADASKKDSKRSSGGRTSGAQTQAAGSGKSGKESDKSKGSEAQSVYQQIDINAPWLVENFVSGGEIKVGFMSVMGRLCIYSGPDKYHSITITGSKDTMIPFNLKTPRLSVYGYGCKSSVLSCHMTFKKRGWMTLPEMGNTGYEGHKYPLTDDKNSGIRAGDCADGTMVSMVVPNDDQKSAKGNGKASRMYGAIFREYMEVDMTESEDKAKARQDSTKREMTESNYNTGMINPWGRIHMVRSKKKVGMHKNEPFWFVYFEADELSSKTYTPSGNEVQGEAASSVRGDAGFPILYNISANKPQDTTSTVVQSDDFVDVSNDIISFSASRQLDSPKPIMIESTGSLRLFNSSGKYSDYLSKARGIKVWLKWSKDESVTFEDSDIVFTGIAFGRNGSYAPGEEYITFECADHWKVLEGIPIMNSPYYDGRHIFTAVDDLCGRAGISSVDDVDKTQGKKGGPLYYFLGQGLAYDKPMFRFSSETPIKDCIVNAMKGFELYLYFDMQGKLHMVPIPGGFLFNYVHPAWDPNVKETYYMSINQTSAPHRLMLDGLEMVSTLSSSVFNSIFVRTIDRGTGAPLIISRSIKESLTEPDSVGYLGFIKEVRYDRTDLGNEVAGNRFVNMMQQMHGRPGFEVEFNTVGHNPVFRPGQFISLKKNEGDESEIDFFKKKFRVTKYSHNYESSGNTWKTSIGAYQVTQPSDSFSPTADIPSEKPVDPDPDTE